MIYRLAACLIGLILSLPALSQTSSNRCKWVPVTTQPFTLDTLTVVPGTLTIARGNKDLSFSYNPNTNKFQFTFLLVPDSTAADSVLQPGTVSDSVLICYRVLPLNLALARYRRKLTQADTLRLPGQVYTEPFSQKEEIFSTPGLNKNGSITRGISFGNKQNVFVNSALNLQLDGKLSEDIAITAAITDQNIPFQPEGNTQQLQEFDKVYISLQHRLWNITGGDVVLRNKPTQFLRFYKNVQGGVLEVNQSRKTGFGSSTTVAASVAKGKFASVVVPAAEGVQGPYRVSGPNGEKFIIILANSEKVYLDGVLLERGYDFDYIIDYNQAEITFTTRRLITRFSRIRVDFEYSDRNYNRSIYHASHYQDLNKLHLNFNIYSEADNQNNLLTLSLKDSEKLLLQSIGDSLNQAITSGAELASYDRELILYKDSTVLVNGLPRPIYIYTQDSTLSTYYTVRFSDVGSNRGDYVQQATTVNGRIYKYVAPINGLRQGNYLPVRILPTPKKRQMVTLGANYQVDKHTTVYIETATSENDENKFSRLDSQDDKGQAVKFGYALTDKRLSVLPDYKVRSAFNYEYTDANFLPIDRYRDIDFNRDWSTMLLPQTKASDNIVNFSLGAHKNLNNLVQYRISKRYRQNEVNGTQHYLDLAREVAGFSLKSGFFLLNSTTNLGKSDWVRGVMDVSYPQGRVVPGYAYRFDKNRVSLRTRPDSLLGSAMYYDEHNVYLRSPDSAKVNYRLDYTYRQDRLPLPGELSRRNYSQTYHGFLQTKVARTQDINILATYRSVNSLDSASESSILSTVNWLGELLNRHLRSDLNYSIATGREPRRQYEFVEVSPGQGTHYLIAGGNPQNLNDYFEAQVPDAQYRTHIKIFLPTDQYVKAFSNRFTYRLNSSMPRSWRGKSPVQHFFSQFTAVTYLNIDKKTTDENLGRRFNPFSLEIADSLLISQASAFRNTIFYNRSDPTFGVEFTYQQNQQKVLLINGTDVRNIGSGTLLGRYNFNQLLSSKLTIARFIRESGSNYLTTKNFRIKGYDISPELAYQQSNTWRFTGSYIYTQKLNLLTPGPDKGVFHELGLESRLSQVNKWMLTAHLRYIQVSYTGDENTAIGYEMLNALRPGHNLTWNFILQQRLRNGLNISVNYDGRKPQDQEIIHMGRTQVSVLF